MKNVEANNVRGVMSRLLKNEEGNVIAVMAAAVLPVIGVVGGGVDMSRLYLVQTRMQSACDSGALMGRRVMAGGAFTDNSEAAKTKALQMFDANFKSGAYGTNTLTRNFTETGGNVTGTASVTVPLTLMRVFGRTTQQVSVNCDAELRLPATDVMFVLDTTGSMNCPTDSSTCTDNGGVEHASGKIKGLRKATLCFYEALTKKNIDNTISDAEDCGETGDPSGSNSDVRIRFGFVPYSVNVNAGKLLPLNYMADNWSYQSREARYSGTGSGYTSTYGPESTPPTVLSDVTSPATEEAWIDRPEGQDLKPVKENKTWYWAFKASQASACNITMPSDIPAPTTGDRDFVSQSPTTPTHPQTSVTRIYERVDGTVTYRYKYVFVTLTAKLGEWKKGDKICRMQRQAYGITTRTIRDQVTVPVYWTDNRVFAGWRYKQTTFDIKGLKDSANNKWKSSVSLPIGTSGAMTSLNWSGCIEERQTARVMDNDPSDNWDPIPAAALDLDIEAAPTIGNPTTQWGPLLGNAVWTRYHDGDKTTAIFDSNTSNQFSNDNSVGRPTQYCPTESKLYQVWEPNGALSFSEYVGSLRTGGNTYHDIGLLWGARLMAPEGIFTAVTNDTQNLTERHMIFMTDGDTNAGGTDYSAYGVQWWDRRQNDASVGQSDTWLEGSIDARAQAICKWVRNENITLWVISYGQGVNSATDAALTKCATSGRFFKANNTAKLITDFKNIANQISALRLTE